MNVWLCSPAWRRYSITRLALAERRWLCDELAARGLQADSVIIADDENLDIAREYGFATVEMDNTDLGRRFNAGFQYAATQGADILVHVGSDDWIHPDAFRFLDHIDLNEPVGETLPADFDEIAIWNPGPTVMAQRKLAIVDLVGRRGCRCDVNAGQWGCIPWFIPRAALEPSAFAPIHRPGLMRGADSAVAIGIDGSQPNWRFQHDADHLWCVDFKSDTNVTAYKGLVSVLGNGEEDPWPMLAAAYPAWLVELAIATSERDPT